MNLGIEGRVAVVCASSKGLGKACAMSLAEAGCEVFINGRNEASLEAAARDIRQTSGAKVTAVLGNIGSDEGRAAMLAACGQADILVTNNAGPPPKNFRELDHGALIEGVEANMITPIMLIQAYIDGMIERRFGRIINITSGSVKAPLAGLDLSSGARAGLTAFTAGIARETAGANVTINHILPGAFDTDRQKGIAKAQSARTGKSVDEVWEARAASIPAKRYGDPAEFGDLCAFIASARAGYITGQNLLIDGGVFPGAF